MSNLERKKTKRQSVIFLGWIKICILSTALESHSYGARDRLCEQGLQTRVQVLDTNIKSRQVLLPVIPVLGSQIQGIPGTNWLAKVARIGEVQVQGETRPQRVWEAMKEDSQGQPQAPHICTHTCICVHAHSNMHPNTQTIHIHTANKEKSVNQQSHIWLVGVVMDACDPKMARCGDKGSVFRASLVFVIASIVSAIRLLLQKSQLSGTALEMVSVLARFIST